MLHQVWQHGEFNSSGIDDMGDPIKKTENDHCNKVRCLGSPWQDLIEDSTQIKPIGWNRGTQNVQKLIGLRVIKESLITQKNDYVEQLLDL